MGRLISSSSTKPRKQYSNLGQCRKHPKHRQSPGVCSLCLTEKLSRVSTTSSSTACSSGYSRARLAYYYSNSSSSSDDEDDSYVSSPGSPVPVPVPGHRRIASDVRRGNKGIIVNGLMGKSRSMGVVARNEEEEVEVEEDGKLKDTGMSISGFWSKLLGPKRRTSHLTKMVSQSNPLPVY